MQHDKYINEQLEYYRERAGEYDEWFLRQGRYNYGEASTKQWFKEVADLQEKLASLKPLGKVLELACGTGWWTEQLLSQADSVTAIDASSEVILLNKARTKSAKLHCVQANLFEWQPEECFDFIFFSFWLSHVPPERFESFWQTVAAALKPTGRVFFIDSIHKQEASSKDQIIPQPDTTIAKRKLKDGREFEIVKLFYEPQSLSQRLTGLGWQANIHQTESFFLYGSLSK